MPTPTAQPAPEHPLKVRYGTTPADQQTSTFTQSFRIGRTHECEICIKNEYVSRVHAEAAFENGRWWVRDLNSSNGLYVDGHRVERVAITPHATVRLGIEGPELFFESSAPPQSATYSDLGKADAQSKFSPGSVPRERARVGSGTILRQYVQHYFKPANGAAVGEHTMYVRRAFAKVQSEQKRTYSWIIVALILAAICVGGYALYEHQQLQRQRALAEDLFYAMKSLDLDIARLEKAVAQSGSEQGARTVQQYASRRGEMQNNYDHYLSALHTYDRNMTEQRRIVLRVARIFGECELDMPRDFEAEINKYIKYWQQSDRLAAAIRTAQQNGYVDTISKELLAQGLPPQFFYLALQESNFDPYASGPVTRKGIAKGMWQFIPETAVKYGLRIGPLADLRRPDPGDERDRYEKATKAAARYMKDLYSTDAQASGLLVMACYNWGEDQVLPLVRSMPANPRDRNFWRLLAQHRESIPQETYDYVFYITSAAVIGENPHLFGFDFDNPLEHH
jgi:peptidoglycan lytic transglycosylase D